MWDQIQLRREILELFAELSSRSFSMVASQVASSSLRMLRKEKTDDEVLRKWDQVYRQRKHRGYHHPVPCDCGCGKIVYRKKRPQAGRRCWYSNACKMRARNKLKKGN